MRQTVVRSLAGLLTVLLLLGSQASLAENQQVDINTASVSELTALNGIGNVKAQAIVEYREKNGGFKTVDELKAVRGIGDKTLEQLRPHVTVGARADKKTAKQ